MFHKVYENNQWTLVYSGKDDPCGIFSGLAKEFGTAKLLTISTKQDWTQQMNNGKYFSVEACYLEPLKSFLASLGYACESVYQNDDYCLRYPIAVGRVYFKCNAPADQVHDALTVVKEKIQREEQETKSKGKKK